MAEKKAKIFYFSVFILAVFAFIFHVTAMGYHHWKKADSRNNSAVDQTTIGLFTRCTISSASKIESCFPNLFPNDASCSVAQCLSRNGTGNCLCDFLPSTKGIAACAILASIFLGLAIIILFIHSINTSETPSVGVCLSVLPLVLLLLTFIFILITLILVGSYLSRDMMYVLRQIYPTYDLATLRDTTRDFYKVRVDWSTGLEIISLLFSFLSLIFYTAFVFKFGRS